MAFDNSFTAVTGATYTAAQYNTYTKGNFTAIWVGTNAGDVDYYSSASAKTRLAKPAVLSVLTNDTSGVPAWLAKSAIGGIHTAAMVNVSPGGQTGSGWTDITSATTTLTLAAGTTYKIVVLAVVTGYDNIAGEAFAVRASVGGTADTTAVTAQQFNGGATISRNEALPYIYYVAGVSSGSCVVKMQTYFVPSSPGSGSVERCRFVALAFSE